jgi:hypothetical protein
VGGHEEAFHRRFVSELGRHLQEPRSQPHPWDSLGHSEGNTWTFAVSESFLSWIKALLNKPLDIWVISTVCRRVTKGRELTMINLWSLILAVPTNWVFKLVFGKKPREFPQIAKLLSDIRSRSKPGAQADSISLVSNNISSVAREQAPPVQFSAMARMSVKSQMPVTQFIALEVGPGDTSGRDPASEGTYKPVPINIQELTKRPSVSWLKCVWRLGNLIKGAGTIVYTFIDTILTGLTWRTLGPDLHTEEDGEWRKGPAVYMAIVLTAGSFPFEKFGRNALGVTVRILS